MSVDTDDARQKKIATLFGDLSPSKEEQAGSVSAYHVTFNDGYDTAMRDDLQKQAESLYRHVRDTLRDRYHSKHDIQRADVEFLENLYAVIQVWKDRQHLQQFSNAAQTGTRLLPVPIFEIGYGNGRDWQHLMDKLLVVGPPDPKNDKVE